MKPEEKGRRNKFLSLNSLRQHYLHQVSVLYGTKGIISDFKIFKYNFKDTPISFIITKLTILKDKTKQLKHLF
jgi:hypothetical protein